jgi:hypothetical protein
MAVSVMFVERTRKAILSRIIRLRLTHTNAAPEPPTSTILKTDAAVSWLGSLHGYHVGMS